MGIDEVSERIGSLDGRVGGLDHRVETLTTTWQQQDREATEGRRKLHAKFEAMQEKVLAELRDVAVKLTVATARMDNIDREIAAMKPRADQSHDERQQAIGSKKALAVVWGVFVGLVTALTTGLVELIHWWMRLPPPSAH